MKRTFNFLKGYKDINYSYDVTVEVELKEKEGKPCFSASAYVWDKKHRDIIMGGQCLDELVEHLKDYKEFMKIYRLWKLYHLNDMHAWCSCEHKENSSEKIKVYKLRYSEEGEKLSKIRDLGKFKEYITVTEEGMKNIPSALYELCAYKSLGDTGIKEETRGWITYDKTFSPEGLLGKECPKCKSKYGHAWYYHEIPADDLQAIKTLLES